MSSEASPAKRRQSFAVHFAGGGAFADEVFEDSEMPFAGRDHHRRSAVAVRHFHFCSATQEEVHRFPMASLNIGLNDESIEISAIFYLIDML